jgi:uncharacterized membrane protein YphA (DoxX/SURF4 family)
MELKTRNIIVAALQICLGAAFISSGILKLFPVEPLELHIFSYHIISWSASLHVARLLIGAEIALGLLLCIGCCRKFTIDAALACLIVFSALLVYSMVFRDDANCFCFGEALPMSPGQSLVKNMFLVAIALMLRMPAPGYVLVNSKKIMAPVAAAAILCPFAIDVPDTWVKKSFPSRPIEDPQYKYWLLPDTAAFELSTGNKVAAYLSPYCHPCKLAASKLSSIRKRLAGDDAIFCFFYTDTAAADKFWSETGIEPIPSFFIGYDQFAGTGGVSTPAVLYISEGKIVKKLAYRGVFEDDLRHFLETGAPKHK